MEKLLGEIKGNWKYLPSDYVEELLEDLKYTELECRHELVIESVYEGNGIQVIDTSGWNYDENTQYILSGKTLIVTGGAGHYIYEFEEVISLEYIASLKFLEFMDHKVTPTPEDFIHIDLGMEQLKELMIEMTGITSLEELDFSNKETAHYVELYQMIEGCLQIPSTVTGYREAVLSVLSMEFYDTEKIDWITPFDLTNPIMKRILSFGNYPSDSQIWWVLKLMSKAVKEQQSLS